MAVLSNKVILRATAAVAIAETVVVDGTYILESVRLHLSAAGGAVEDFTITMDAGAGAAYDCVLLAAPMNAATDVHYLPAQDIVLQDPDELDIAYTNTNLRTYGLEIVLRYQA